MSKRLTIGSCFSGIGGLELGLERTGGFETIWQIENDPYANRVLMKHWPEVKKYSDIKQIDVSKLEKVDLICGGYPCQPFSVAGLMKGEDDERNLWEYMHKIICYIRPKFILLENVANHLSLGFGRVLGDLSESGYDAEWSLISACSIGAPHSRERLFCLAYPSGFRWDAPKIHPGNNFKVKNKPYETWRNFGVVCSQKDDGRLYGFPDTDVVRTFNGFSGWVDRLKCLGNAVVPSVAQLIGEKILEF